MNNQCDACGNNQAIVSIGGAMLCRTCAHDVQAEIDSIRAQGKMVNAMGIARRLYRERHDCSDYMLRDIPAELMARIKQRAAGDGSTAREVMLRAIENFLE